MNYNVDTGSAIELRAVHKSFDSHHVLKGIDLDVPAGQVLGLLGPNGAGKTTLIRIMTGLTAADSGAVRVGGVDVVHRPGAVGARVGLAPQDLGLYPQLTVRQNLVCFGRINGLGRHDALLRSDELLAAFDLSPQAGQTSELLSGGQKRRLHTAIALMHCPPVLFLDEPTVGADVASRGRILDAVRDVADNGATVVYTSHYLQEIEQLADRAVILSGGRIVADGSVAEIIAQTAQPALEVEFTAEAPAVEGWVAEGRTLRPGSPVADPAETLAALLTAPAVRAGELSGVHIVPANLETAYLQILSADNTEETADVLVA